MAGKTKWMIVKKYISGADEAPPTEYESLDSARKAASTILNNQYMAKGMQDPKWEVGRVLIRRMQDVEYVKISITTVPSWP
jgi:hypothetical protein